MENNLPETVTAYIAAMHDIMSDDKQMKAEILENEMIDQKVYWSMFETVAMSNYVNNEGDPALTPEQFKEVMINTVKATMESSIEKMKDLGLIEEEEGGLKITEKGIDAFKRAGGNQG